MLDEETSPSSPQPSLAARGLLLGAETGFLLALLYTLAYVALLCFLAARQGSFPEKVLDVALYAALVLAYGFLVGILPSFLIGALTGLALGGVLSRFKSLPSTKVTILVGLALALSIGLPLLGILFLQPRGQAGLFSLFFGVPSLIYVAAAVYVALRLRVSARPSSVVPILIKVLPPNNSLEPTSTAAENGDSSSL